MLKFVTASAVVYFACDFALDRYRDVREAISTFRFEYNKDNYPIRPLTTNETALARSVFGNQIEYRDVRVRDLDFDYYSDDKIALAFVRSNEPNVINFSRDLSLDDLATSDCAERFKVFDTCVETGKALFMHEMTHVYQFTNRVPHQIRERAYEYSLDNRSNFLQMGQEQQASIVADFTDLYLDTPDQTVRFCDVKNKDEADLIRVVVEQFPNVRRFCNLKS